MLNPKRSWESRRISLRHNTYLVAKGLVTASLVTATWYFCYIHQWPVRVTKDGDKVMLTTATLICAAIFSVVAALVFTQTGDRIRELSKAVLLKDQVAFLVLRDEKISLRMHIVLGLFALSILVLLFVAEYETATIGGLIIFVVTLMIVLYFIAIIEMQEISTSAWFRDRVPRQWLTVHLDDHFRLTEVIQENRQGVQTSQQVSAASR